MTRIGIILGSTRTGRKSEAVGEWVLAAANQRDDAEFEIVDLRDYPLPFFDEAISPSWSPSENPQVKAWSAKIASLDGFIFVTPEYNHSTSAVLKNAIDFIFHEWNNKAAAFVGYGAVGGARAIEHLRLIAAEVEIATARHQVGLSLYTDFANFTELTPTDQQVQHLGKTLDGVVAWAKALEPLRAEALVA